MSQQGKEWLVSIADVAGTDNEATSVVIDCQGDLTINSGRSVETIKAKNCTATIINENGVTMEFEIHTEFPLSNSAQKLWAANDGDLTAWFYVIPQKPPTTSGDKYFKYKGQFKVNIDELLNAPVNGLATHKVMLGQDGQFVRTEVTVP